MMAVMFIITGSFASMLTHETREAAKLRRRIQAFHIAEGAIERAINQLNLDQAWRTGWSNASLGVGTYNVTVADVDSTRLKVTATATVESITRKVSIYLLKGGTIPPFNYASFGGEKVQVNNAKIGSYNSGLGLPPIDFNLASSDGDVGTNATNSKAIDVKSSATVKGDAVIGVGGNPANIQDATRITGTKSAATTSINLVSVKLPSTYTYINEINTDMVLSPGNYVVNKIDLKNASVLTTTGPVKIYVGESLKITGNAVVKAESNLPADLAIYGLDAMENEDLDIDGMEKYQASGNALFYGVLYAPKATIIFNGSATGAGVIAAGAFVGKQVKFMGNGNNTLYYDEALRNDSSLQVTSLSVSRAGSWEGEF
jgi:hypothetical protein